MSMIYFGQHALNTDEVVRIDLWYTPELAKVYFRDNDPLVLDADATLEARTFAEDGRRMLRVEDEKDLVDLEHEKFELSRDKRWLEESDKQDKAKKKRKVKRG